jgi:hypothetical protein
LGFDGDAPFPFDVHRVQDLVSKIPVLYKTRILDQTVGQGGFPMVNMGYDAEISNVSHINYIYRCILYYKLKKSFGARAITMLDAGFWILDQPPYIQHPASGIRHPASIRKSP